MNTPESFSRGVGSKRNMAVTGVMLVIFLFAIDATIVATSMPTIVAQLGGLELYSWVFSIYMLTSALATPIFGKLADLFSRRKLMLIGIGIFLLGTILCGAAQSMEAMILFRAVQGVGGGAIYSLSFIVVGILYAPEMRAKMQGIISSIWGVASILGPLAGGIIVEAWNWRWIFFVNLPLIAIASTLIIVGLKEEQRQTRTPKLDLWGATTLLAGLLLLFYALAQSAHEHHPLNAQTLVMIGLGLLILAAFVVIERRAEEPIMPVDLFHIGLFRSSAAVATLCSMGVFGAISYLPLYLQGVLGTAASQAGLVLVFLSLGWTAGSLLAGRWINRNGYRVVAAAGMALLVLGYGIFVAPHVSAGIIAVIVSAVAIGVGMGLANLTTLVAAQTGSPSNRIGVATSTIMLFRTFGGAFAVSLMGTVLLNRMQQGLNQIQSTNTTVPADMWHKLANPQNLLEPSTRAQIPAELLPQLIATLGDAIWYAFGAAFILMLFGLMISFFIPPYTPATTPKPARK
ncbi:MAG: DHA2 family efflux MFS transporter permease subunit [Deltaproteobacteria bacterium]|nr:DHA2 family efflux MFS transporter permease subunit [Deltaproteobacteria bacterium]